MTWTKALFTERQASAATRTISTFRLWHTLRLAHETFHRSEAITNPPSVPRIRHAKHVLLQKSYGANYTDFR
jgi:hypothetical protein